MAHFENMDLMVPTRLIVSLVRMKKARMTQIVAMYETCESECHQSRLERRDWNHCNHLKSVHMGRVVDVRLVVLVCPLQSRAQEILAEMARSLTPFEGIRMMLERKVCK